MTPIPEDPPPLELDGAAFRALVERAVERIAPYLDSLADQPATDPDGGVELARATREPLPERGEAFDDLLDDLFDRRVGKGYNAAGPGYLAYIPGGGVPASAIAELIANAINRYVGVFVAAPALAALEANVIRWFCRLVGLPDTAGGYLSSGGSIANWTAVVAARRERLDDDLTRGMLYTSDQTHHSVVKAASLAGFPIDNVRLIECDDRYRLRVDRLREAIDADRAAGHRPFFIAANGGTTNTGAIDDLTAIAEVAASERLWMHVDAAYGGFFVLTERGRGRLAGIERADSVTLDPHKGLFIPYGTGCLLVRDHETLRRAHHTEADYMPAFQDDPALVDFCEISPELSRGFRGLAVWLPIKLHGAAAFRDALDEKLDLIEVATAGLREIPGVEILAAPQLTVVAFRHVPEGLDEDQLDAHNQAWLAAVNRRRRVFLTPTRLAGRFAIRICILSFRTHRDRVDACLDDLSAALDEIGAK